MTSHRLTRAFGTVGIALALATACGGSSAVPPADRAAGTQARSTAGGAHAGSTSGSHPAQLLVRLRAQGAYEDGAFHYLRIEDHTGELVVEREYRRDSDVRLRTQLAPGRYRVISWQRPCKGACPGAARDRGRLRAPTDICGTKVKTDPDQPLTVTVRLAPGVGCSAGRA